MSDSSVQRQRGEPYGWAKVRIPTWLFDAIREMSVELIDAECHHRGRLPKRFITKGKVPDHYVIAMCLARDIAHSAQSTTGKRQKQLVDRWRNVAQNCRLPPFEEEIQSCSE